MLITLRADVGLNSFYVINYWFLLINLDQYHLDLYTIFLILFFDWNHLRAVYH